MPVPALSTLTYTRPQSPDVEAIAVTEAIESLHAIKNKTLVCKRDARDLWTVDVYEMMIWCRWSWTSTR